MVWSAGNYAFCRSYKQPYTRWVIRKRALLALFLLGAVTHAEPAAPEVIDDLAENIRANRRYEMTPQVSVIQISRLDLVNPGFRVHYDPAMEGLPAFILSIGRPLKDWGNFTFTLQGSVGFGRSSGLFSVLDTETSTASNRQLSLAWIPMTVSLRTAYRIPAFSYLRPSLSFSFGNLTLIQSSEIASLSRTLGIPLISFSPAVTFLDSTNVHWLGGFTFGATFMYGLSSHSTVSATSIDLSLNILL